MSHVQDSAANLLEAVAATAAAAMDVAVTFIYFALTDK
jgi:hypothetical protein